MLKLCSTTAIKTYLKHSLHLAQDYRIMYLISKLFSRFWKTSLAHQGFILLGIYKHFWEGLFPNLLIFGRASSQICLLFIPYAWDDGFCVRLIGNPIESENNAAFTFQAFLPSLRSTISTRWTSSPSLVSPGTWPPSTTSWACSLSSLWAQTFPSLPSLSGTTLRHSSSLKVT